MGKKKEERAAKLRRFVKDYALHKFTTDGKVLYCTVCDCSVGSDQKCQVDQHIGTQRHKDRLAKLKYAPCTSCDVERSFSRFKAVFRSNRQSFAFENLREHLVVHCNMFAEGN